MALKALGILASSEGALQRLMDQSGLDAGTLRDHAGDPDMLASLLDFLLSDEELLTGFCDQDSIDPKAVHLARHMLADA
ncbi:MAG: DUF3572 family protein [Alphaproteobacteria bacterium]|nr:DUF3572 family protein [Alphaproteobacteria bacterium]